MILAPLRATATADRATSSPSPGVVVSVTTLQRLSRTEGTDAWDIASQTRSVAQRPGPDSPRTSARSSLWKCTPLRSVVLGGAEPISSSTSSSNGLTRSPNGFRANVRVDRAIVAGGCDDV